MRLTQHSGRGTRSGPYNPKHNDRQFDVKSAENIDMSRMGKNQYFGYTSAGKPVYYEGRSIGGIVSVKDGVIETVPTFEEQEKRLYKEHFTGQFERQMDLYRKKGNKSRIVDFETWMRGVRYVPEETVYQVGKVGDSPDDETEITDCYKEIVQYLTGLGAKYGFYHVNSAVHFDEDGVPHLHYRRVWHYTDANGIECIGQEKALEQAGVKLPKPDEPAGRYNNRKMTFDAFVRKGIIKIAEKHGFTIEKEPVKGAKHNRSKQKYLIDTATEMRQETDARQAALDARQAELDERERILKQAELANIKRFGEIERLFNQVSDAAAQAELGPQIDELRRKLPDVPPDQPQPTGPETEF